MTLVTRPAMSDDSGVFTDGTVVTKAFIDLIYEQIDDQAHSTTNPTIKPKAIIDEVVAARGSKVSLDARLDVSINEDGTLNISFDNVSGGLRVGFAGTTSVDRIDIGDANFYLDFAAGGAGIPGIFFDTGDSYHYSRAGDQHVWNIGATNKLTISSTTLTLGTNASGVNQHFAYGAKITARNALDLATLDYIQFGSGGVTNQLILGAQADDIKWGKALVALGGGAAPTLGTIGGSGPAVAAQNTWMRVIDSTGAAFFVPAWK